jgi:hypothetical protein
MLDRREMIAEGLRTLAKAMGSAFGAVVGFRALVAVGAPRTSEGAGLFARSAGHSFDPFEAVDDEGGDP